MEKIAKRIFDFVFSLFGLIILSPLFLIIAVLIMLDSKGPIFFGQNRVGKNGIMFKIFKFRTMNENAEKMGINFATVQRDPRITKIGLILRKYKIDELPQLINVFLGNMSFVGPRPEVENMVKLYNEEQKQILKIKPGITDYASLEFRNENEMLSQGDNTYEVYVKKIMPQKLKLSLKYLKEQSFFLDFKLIIRTVYNIIFDSIK